MAKILNTVCAYCGYKHDRTSQVADKQDLNEQQGMEADMEPGDYTMCIACGEMNVLSNDYTLRMPNENETTEMATDERIKAMRWAFKAARAH